MLCYSEGFEGYAVYYLHHQDEDEDVDPSLVPRLDTVEDSAGSDAEGGDGSVAAAVEFYLADRRLTKQYFPDAAEGEDDVSDPPVAVITDSEEAATMSQIFCGANPFCYTCDELSDFASKNIDVVDWRSPPRKKPRMGVRVPVCVKTWPELCNHHQEWLDKNITDKWSWLFHSVKQQLLSLQDDLFIMAPRIRGIHLMIIVYAGDGSNFFCRSAMQEQGYTSSLKFAFDLYKHGTAAGYVKWPYIMTDGPVTEEIILADGPGVWHPPYENEDFYEAPPEPI